MSYSSDDFSFITSISHLRTWLTYAHVCEHLGIKLNGSRLEGKVSVTGRQRSGKFIKHLKGTTIPTRETINELAKLAPNVTSLFYCPLWNALKMIEDNKDDFFCCFEKLDIEVQSCVLDKRRNELGGLSFKWIQRRDLLKLYRIGGLHALACLVLLRFLFEEETFGVTISFIDDRIIDVLINLRAAHILPYNFSLLIDKLSNVFAWHSSFLMQAHIIKKRIDEEVTRKETLLCNLRKLHPSSPATYSIKVLVLFNDGNSDLILRESKYVNESNGSPIPLSPQNKKGLYWLLKKLNRDRDACYSYLLTDTNSLLHETPCF